MNFNSDVKSVGLDQLQQQFKLSLTIAIVPESLFYPRPSNKLIEETKKEFSDLTSKFLVRIEGDNISEIYNSLLKELSTDWLLTVTPGERIIRNRQAISGLMENAMWDNIDLISFAIKGIENGRVTENLGASTKLFRKNVKGHFVTPVVGVFVYPADIAEAFNDEIVFAKEKKTYPNEEEYILKEIDALQKYLKTADCNVPFAIEQLAGRYFTLKNWEEAYSLYRSYIISLRPQPFARKWIYYFRMVECLRFMKRLKTAKDLANEAIRFWGAGKVEWMYMLGLVLYEEGNLVEAYNHLSRAISRGMNNANADLTMYTKIMLDASKICSDIAHKLGKNEPALEHAYRYLRFKDNPELAKRIKELEKK